ncbi:predicted protein, partial [Naegleria gruberi]
SNGYLNTYAGTMSQAFCGDNENVTVAKFDYLQHIAFNSLGELVIADVYNHRIRKVAVNGIVSTIAGSLNLNYVSSGDGGPATSAKLINPYGFCYTKYNELIIAETNNNRLRKVSSSGIITTLAGTGTAGYGGDGQLSTSNTVLLNNPRSVYCADSGDIYFTDTDNYRIRKVDTNGYISTVVGTGSSTYNGELEPLSTNIGKPLFVTIFNGTLYFSDDSYRIRKVYNNVIVVGGTG